MVLERAWHVLDEASGNNGGAIYLAADDHAFVLVAGRASAFCPERLDDNDPAILRLRAYRTPTSLEGSRSALGGDRVVPMIVRGALFGFALVARKRAGDPYAPDEGEALAGLALAVGATVDALDVERLRAAVASVLEGDGGEDALALRARLRATVKAPGAVLANDSAGRYAAATPSEI